MTNASCCSLYVAPAREAPAQRHNKPPARAEIHFTRPALEEKNQRVGNDVANAVLPTSRLSFFYLSNRTLSAPLSGTIPREPTGAQKTLFIHKRNRKRQLSESTHSHTRLILLSACAFIHFVNSITVYSKFNCPSNSFGTIQSNEASTFKKYFPMNFKARFL